MITASVIKELKTGKRTKKQRKKTEKEMKLEETGDIITGFFLELFLRKQLFPFKLKDRLEIVRVFRYVHN